MERLEGFVEVTPLLRAGVYALIWQGKVVYVGQAICVGRRVEQHSRNIVFDRVFARFCPKEDLDVLEQEWIERLNPRLNRVRVSPVLVKQRKRTYEDWKLSKLSLEAKTAMIKALKGKTKPVVLVDRRF